MREGYSTRTIIKKNQWCPNFTSIKGGIGRARPGPIFGILIPLLLFYMGYQTAWAESDDVSVDYPQRYHKYIQILRGESFDLHFSEKGLIIKKVSVVPKAGIEVSFSEDSPSQGNRKLAKSWTITLTTQKDALLGERELKIKTKGGKFQQKLRVISHRPHISDIRVISTTPKLLVEYIMDDNSGNLWEKGWIFTWFIYKKQSGIIMQGGKLEKISDGKFRVIIDEEMDSHRKWEIQKIAVWVTDVDGNYSNFLIADIPLE